MYKNLHFKIILILAIFTITLMSVIGAVLISSAFNFYSNDFITQMEQAFDPDGNLAAELTGAFHSDDFAARQNEILKAYSGVLGIDKYRDYFILDTKGDFLFGSSSDGGETLEKTPNIVSALSGKTGARKNLRTSYIDYATRLSDENGNSVIICVKDSQDDVRSLSAMIFRITVQAMFFGMLAAIALSFFLAKAITEPIRTLTVGAQKIAEGEFDQSVNVKANDEIGALSETFNYMKDVLKGTLDEISGERRKFETLFLYLNDAVIAFDSFGGLMHINKMAKRLFHFDAEGGERFLSLFNFTQMIKLLNIDYRHIAEEYKEKGTYSLSDVIYDGKALDIMLADFRYTENNAESHGVMCVIHDITERYELDKSRREFVADVSHELRTPIQCIRGAVETVMECPTLPADMRDDFLHMAIDECDRMTRIVGDLLVLSRLDNRRTQWKVETFYMDDFMSRMHDIMSGEAKAHSHTLVFDCAEGIPPVTADKEKIQQALINIISNSVKYTKNGGRIEVSCAAARDGVKITVRDNGMGIPKEDIPRLFERFYRVEKARTSDAGGTGLGLAITKEIIDAHGGKIRVESELGKGTATYVLLPYKCTLPAPETGEK